jgi:hypothetical protein
MDYINMSCTKIRSFLEGKRAEWFSDNITLTELQLIKRKIYQCSPQVYAKMSRFFGFIEHSIARKK